MVVSYSMDEKNLPDSRQGSQMNEPRSVPFRVRRHPLNVVFFNDLGLRSGWRIATYLFQILLLKTIANAILDHVFHVPKTETFSFWQMFIFEALGLVIVFLPALV